MIRKLSLMNYEKRQKKDLPELSRKSLKKLILFTKLVARVTRLELATSGVTGQRSNQLSYTPGNLYMVGGNGLEPLTLSV